ncbi:MAG: FAD-dependent oxidoreductase [Microbacterium sp.]|uniref:protoporphyrinogen/coproporphyrinogen oxidase n=1 Tax=Microbacterium sp. TaxID=51671 RepID=UPI001ACB26E4|nr:FAD-dependent oxidoreductase [Microbacterium sp.]MBN9154565.1 FAD-dependent oxidoreductase [Microbacterium sp.]
MTIDDTPSFAELAARAGDVRVAVVGGGMAGLVAALECAKLGIAVTVFEASDRLGGVLRSARVAGIAVDAGAESYATRGGSVRALIDDLGLSDAVVSPAAGRAWVAGLPGGDGKDAAPLPVGGVLGIPENVWAPDVVRILGRSGAWRAYLDRLRPPLTIGHDRSLGHLVRSRMGERVLDRLVAPVTSGVYSSRPDDIDVDLAAPGLNAALTRTGSLSGAVGALRAPRADAAKAPGGAVEGLHGGMWRLADALRERLVSLGADIRLDAPVAEILPMADEEAAADGPRWRVRVAPTAAGEDDTDPVPDATRPESAGRAPDATFHAVVVATPEPVARRLLAPVVPGLDPVAAPAPVVEIVTLVVADPALDDAPRGTGVLTVPGSHVAKALTHATAKWAWLAEAAGPGVHVVRVSFGAQGEEPATAGMGDADAAALALAEASALLGVPLAADRLRGAHRERFAQSQPAATLGRPELVRTARAAVGRVPGLAAVGAWLSGTGLAQVVPDAAAEGDRIRRAALWGGATPAE